MINKDIITTDLATVYDEICRLSVGEYKTYFSPLCVQWIGDFTDKFIRTQSFTYTKTYQGEELTYQFCSIIDQSNSTVSRIVTKVSKSSNYTLALDTNIPFDDLLAKLIAIVESILPRLSDLPVILSLPSNRK